jgi:hypothetical protein
VNVVGRAFRQFYREDARPWIMARLLELHDIYVGENWQAINGYERIGRAICGTLLLVVWIIGTLIVVFGTVRLWTELMRGILT